MRLRLLPALALLAACSNPTTEQQATTTAPAAKPVAKAADKPALASSAKKPAPKADTVAVAAPDTAASAAVQNVAAYLAGRPPQAGSPLAALAAQPAWQSFAKDQDKSWARYGSTHTSRMEKWAARELDSVRAASATLFYPFSGPDFLNAYTLFPSSRTYVLFGLEPVGSVPSQAALRNPALFRAVKTSLWSVLNFSFFRTNDMAVDLKSVNLDGAVPLLMLFAARTNCQVLAVRQVQLDAEGKLQAASASADAKTIPGAELQLRAADGSPKTVYYFSADLSDYKLNTKDAPLRYARTLGPVTTYLKSATYLMHKSYFSKIRTLVLDQSQYILQDDSGIAMKYFPRQKWDFTYYGTYRRPIPLFAKQYQPALTVAYRDSLRRPRPLPFGTGYNWQQANSNLLLARRKR